MNTEEQRTCESCNKSSIIIEIPGQFRDFDADRELHGTMGIPLCSECLGTGWYVNTKRFLTLSQEASRIRKENFRIQLKARENKNWIAEVEVNNKGLVEIARKALAMVNQPNKNCLAIKLSNGEWK